MSNENADFNFIGIKFGHSVELWQREYSECLCPLYIQEETQRFQFGAGAKVGPGAGGSFEESWVD